MQRYNFFLIYANFSTFFAFLSDFCANFLKKRHFPPQSCAIRAHGSCKACYGREKRNAPLSTKIEAQGDVCQEGEEEKEESYGAGAVEPRDTAPFPPIGTLSPTGARDSNADGIYPGDGDSVGVVPRVPAVAVGGVVAVDIDCVGNAIPPGGGYLEGIAARRDGIPSRTPHSLNLAGTPLGRRQNALGEADGHTVVDVLADAIRSGINAKVGAVASVGGWHGHVLGAATTHEDCHD